MDLNPNSNYGESNHALYTQFWHCCLVYKNIVFFLSTKLTFIWGVPKAYGSCKIKLQPRNFVQIFFVAEKESTLIPRYSIRLIYVYFLYGITIKQLNQCFFVLVLLHRLNKLMAPLAMISNMMIKTL